MKEIEPSNLYGYLTVADYFDPCPLFLDETGLILDETGLNLALAHLWGRSFRGSRAYSQRLFSESLCSREVVRDRLLVSHFLSQSNKREISRLKLLPKFLVSPPNLIELFGS